MLGKVVMKEKTSEAYLGDNLCSKGLRASTAASNRDKVAKVKGSIYKLCALMEDFRMQVVGGMRAAINIYKSCIVSSLLTNSGTWTSQTRRSSCLMSNRTRSAGPSCRYLHPQGQPSSSLRSDWNAI